MYQTRCKVIRPGGCASDEQIAFLHQQIDTLPESYRLLITLRYQHELSYAEIAEVVDMLLGTVKTEIFRARARLRKQLHQFEEGSNEPN